MNSSPAAAGVPVLGSTSTHLPLKADLLNGGAEVRDAADGPTGSANAPFGTAPLMSILDACREARVGRTTIYAQIKVGALLAVKVGRRTLIRRADFLAWIDSLRSLQGRR